MFNMLIHYFYPKMNKEDVKKFSLLALIFMLIIGAYWALRVLKDTIFFKVAFPESSGWAFNQGTLFQPIAKTLSPFVVLLLVLIYSKLIDIFKKHQLFYIICSFYAVIFGLLTIILFINDHYGAQILGKEILAFAGWASYFAVESFGSLASALFWSFTNSITTSESAKEGFPIVISFAQIAAIAGAGMLFFSDKIGSLWPILLCATILVSLIIPIVRYFMQVIPAQNLVGNKEAAKTEKKKEGFLEGFFSGIWLLLTRPYLIGVLIISTAYEAIAQIIEYQMKNQASCNEAYCSVLGFARFQSIYGMSINAVSFLIAFLGTSKILQKYGTRIALLIYPISFFIALSLMLIYYLLLGSSNPSSLLWLTFAIMVIVKGMGYAVNNPTKEIMYIPTSKDAKFKSKGWIDTFGSRFAKLAGAQVTNTFKYSVSDLMLYGTLFGFGLNFIWFFAALYVGKKNTQLLKEGKIIE